MSQKGFFPPFYEPYFKLQLQPAFFLPRALQNPGHYLCNKISGPSVIQNGM